ncbi:MAG: precorrin-6A reductase [Thermoleophilia bacterium]|nr:precorrin-6A reductase [Thermoleophilia bacterium]
MSQTRSAPALYLIGGTGEANQAAARLQAEGYSVTVSVATPWGAVLSAEAGSHLADTGPKDACRMARRASELGAAAIVDCSHPYALAASDQARLAARQAGLPYLRYSRPASPIPKADVIRAASFSEALEILKDRPGRALLTVGTRHLEPFVREHIDFTARILPVPESLAECERLGMDPRDIIAAHPPFSVEFNRACIRHSRAGILLTKDSGLEGGLMEKADAAAAEGIELLVVDRPAEPGAIHDLEILVRSLTKLLAK